MLIGHPLLQSPVSVRECEGARPCYRGWPRSELTRPSLSGMPSTSVPPLATRNARPTLLAYIVRYDELKFGYIELR